MPLEFRYVEGISRSGIAHAFRLQVRWIQVRDAGTEFRWITQLCIINADGTGFHPTWIRDGKTHGEATPN